MSKESPYSNWRPYLLRGLLIIGKPLTPLKWLFNNILLSISPNVPQELSKTFRPRRTKHIFWETYFVALFFCFFVTAGLCALEGTLFGSDENRRYFVEDGWNIILYTAVCPVYVALAMGMMRLTISHWSDLVDYADEKNGLKKKYNRSSLRLPLFLFFVLLLCTGFITNYMHDVLNPAVEVADNARVYWFMIDVGNGIRTLNRVGYYYVVLNFLLLFITLIGAGSFLSLAAEVLRAAESDSVTKIDTFSVLYSRLNAFTNSYLLTKTITAVYVLNMIIWAMSPLGKTDNLWIAQVALFCVGVFFVAVPRQYIQIRWYELWLSSGKRFVYKDSRDAHIRSIVSFLDSVFITALIGSIGFDLKKVSELIYDLISK